MLKNVLVVDDEPDILNLTRLVLKKAGIDVVTARDAEECLMKLEYERPDLILLDVVMPGMNGFELCKKLKGNPKTKNIRIVLYTVLDRERDRELSTESGADGFLNKPLTPEDLSAFARKIQEFLNLPKLNNQ